MLIGDWDVRPERWIGGDDVGRTKGDILLGCGEVGEMAKGELEELML